MMICYQKRDVDKRTRGKNEVNTGSKFFLVMPPGNFDKDNHYLSVSSPTNLSPSVLHLAPSDLLPAKKIIFQNNNKNLFIQVN